MELTPLTTFIASATVFVALALFVYIEQKRGRRIFLGGLRGGIDVLLVKFVRWCKEQWKHFVRYILQLGWYYSIHSLLRTVLRVLVATYDYIEAHFERNRLRTKDLRAEKQQRGDGHLSAMAEHKAEVALTKRQQQALRKKKLEEGD